MEKANRKRFADYTLGEEIFNSVAHGVGTLLSIAATALVIIFAAIRGNVYGVVSGALYGAMMIILYTMSTLYHSLTNPGAKKVFRIMDHCSIFLLIAGTYTPICLCTLRENGGWLLFSIIWGCAVLGIVLNAINLEKFKKISLLFYVAMGLAALFKMKTLVSLLPVGAIVFLAAGGAMYLTGIIFYLMKKVRYMHSVWHLFVLGGSVLHFFCILFYVV